MRPNHFLPAVSSAVTVLRRTDCRIDQLCGDQRLKQLAASPDVQFGSVGCLHLADLIHGFIADAMRDGPVEGCRGCS